jgi:hypothetical protein
VPTYEEKTWKRLMGLRWPLGSDTTLLIDFSLLLQNISMSDPFLSSFSRTTSKSLKTNRRSSGKVDGEHQGSQLITGFGNQSHE